MNILRASLFRAALLTTLAATILWTHALLTDALAPLTDALGATAPTATAVATVLASFLAQVLAGVWILPTALATRPLRRHRDAAVVVSYVALAIVAARAVTEALVGARLAGVPVLSVAAPLGLFVAFAVAPTYRRRAVVRAVLRKDAHRRAA